MQNTPRMQKHPGGCFARTTSILSVNVGYSPLLFLPSVIFPKRCRCAGYFPFKSIQKIFHRVIAGSKRDLLNRKIRSQQQITCVPQADLVYILRQRYPQPFRELHSQIIRCNCTKFRKLCKIYILLKVCVDIRCYRL